MSHPVRILVAVPSHELAPVTFAMDYGAMMSFNGSNLPMNTELIQLGVFGTYIHSARQELAEAALRHEADFILWLDTDMRFPKDSLFRLMKHLARKDVDIVGINYSTREFPPRYVGIKHGMSDDPNAPPLQKLQTTTESTGLERVDGLGFGLVLMDASVLRALPDPKLPGNLPWFWFEWMAEKGIQRGEDVRFFNLVRELGFKVWADHDLSKVCAHTGMWEYKLDHIKPVQDAMSARDEEDTDGAV